jgi:diacylglycerol kinase (ATP)
MNKVKKVVFIINRFAGGGFKPEFERLIVQGCTDHDTEPILEYTKGPGHAITLAREYSKTDVSKVVAVGGDGTLNEVAQGLVHTSMPLGIIPRGSGNGLARHLCIPLTVAGATQTLFTGEVVAMDTFTLNDKLSLNVSGIGFDGRIANLFGGTTKRGLSGYVKLALQEFFRFHEFQAEIRTDAGTLKKDAFIIAIANSSQYGNNACIAPKASVSDGILHINILRKVAPYRFDFLYAFFSKSIDRTNVAEIIEVKNFSVHTPLPVAFHVDGEPSGTGTDFDIKLNPASLLVTMPRK